MSEPQLMSQNGHDDGAQPADEPPPSQVAQRVQKLIREFQDELREVTAQRVTVVQRHGKELAAIDNDIKLIESTIAGLTGRPAPAMKQFKKKPQPRRVGRSTATGTATGFGISLEAAYVASKAIIRMVAERVERGEPETFTQKEFYKHLDWDQSKASQAVRFFRDIEFLRKAGRREDTGAELWAVMDAEAVERQVRMAEQRTEEYDRQIRGESANPRERIVDCLREAGEFESWSALARASGIPKGSIDGICKPLAEEGVIAVHRPGTKGGKVKITLGEIAA